MASEPGVKQHIMAHFDLLCFVFFFVARKILKDFPTSLHYSSGLLSDT